MKNYLFFLARPLLLAALLLTSVTATASGGGGESAAPEAMTFTVNVGKTVEEMRILQVKIVLEYATPEAAHRFAEIKPKVQHHVILLLCGEEVSSLLSSEGKQSLQERIAEDLNKVLDETTKTGIQEVLFTDFIVQ